MASKRRNTFLKEKKQETTENVENFPANPVLIPGVSAATRHSYNVIGHYEVREVVFPLVGDRPVAGIYRVCSQQSQNESEYRQLCHFFAHDRHGPNGTDIERRRPIKGFAG
ncbi:hypothetical protein AAG570_000551 [Ranatra chinensis]|uniref:Uncharacterized protein n=1 Tax=Ranatra chinensis TaxID=642074 RepID=A0ABD0YXD9_9HEMI